MTRSTKKTTRPLLGPALVVTAFGSAFASTMILLALIGANGQQPPPRPASVGEAIGRGLETHEPTTDAERAIHERLAGMSTAELGDMVERMQLLRAALDEIDRTHADDPETRDRLRAEVIEASGLMPEGGSDESR